MWLFFRTRIPCQSSSRHYEKNDIKYFPTENETKASTSERAILTIKMRLSRYFTYKDDFTYLPVLQKIAHSYNRTYHRTIGTTPSDVKRTNEEEIRISTYLAQNRRGSKRTPKKRPFKYSLNQYVRVSHLRGEFTRAYDQTYSGEIFQISTGWSGGAMVLGKLPVPGRPTIWITVGQGPTALAVGAGGGCSDIFILMYPFSPLSLSLLETARYRLKYCLKGPLNPKQPTNQPNF